MGIEPVPGWTPRPLPARVAIDGRWCRLEPLNPRHADGLWAAFAGHDDLWQWMPLGPFADRAAYGAWIDRAQATHDPMFFAVIVDGAPLGKLSLLRMDAEMGTAEVGWIAFSPALQRTRAASEAVMLLARACFALGYRRFEWKCDAGNLASRRAAQRFGFSFEGIHRQARVVKGRNRDTAWFSILDGEWPALEAAWDAWLDPANFDAGGRQRRSLSAMTAPILAERDPAFIGAAPGEHVEGESGAGGA